MRTLLLSATLLLLLWSCTTNQKLASCYEIHFSEPGTFLKLELNERDSTFAMRTVMGLISDHEVGSYRVTARRLVLTTQEAQYELVEPNDSLVSFVVLDGIRADTLYGVTASTTSFTDSLLINGQLSLPEIESVSLATPGYDSCIFVPTAEGFWQVSLFPHFRTGKTQVWKIKAGGLKRSKVKLPRCDTIVGD